MQHSTVVSMLLWIFYLLPDFIGLVLAATGFAVIFVPETIKSLDQKPTLRRSLAAFLIVLGIGAVISNKVQHSQESDKQDQAQQRFQGQIDKLTQGLQAEQISHTGDVKYLEGELKVFGDFAPAILKLAQATEFNTRKQYEQKVMTDKELRDYVMQVVKKMRDWQYREQQEESDETQREMAAQSQIYAAHRGENFNSPEGAKDIQQKASQSFNDNRQREENIYLKFEKEFRDTIFADAASAREQLLNRLGASAEPKIETRNKYILLVFQGQLAGPYP